MLWCTPFAVQATHTFECTSGHRASMIHPPVARASLPRDAPSKSSQLREEAGARPSLRIELAAETDEFPELCFASPSSTLDRSSSTSTAASDGNFFDAASEAGSTGSAASGSLGEHNEGTRQQGAELDGSTPEQNRTTHWELQLREEADARTRAEESAKNLASELQALREQIKRLEIEVKSLEKVPNSYEEGAREAAIARLVATVIQKVVADDTAERRWTAEVAALRQRLQQGQLMEAVSEQRRKQELESQVAFQWRLMQIGFAAGCVGCGALAVLLVIKRVKN